MLSPHLDFPDDTNKKAHDYTSDKQLKKRNDDDDNNNDNDDDDDDDDHHESTTTNRDHSHSINIIITNTVGAKIVTRLLSFVGSSLYLPW